MLAVAGLSISSADGTISSSSSAIGRLLSCVGLHGWLE